MSIEHLSEKRLQKYLDDTSTGLSAAELEHLEDCEHCQNVLEDYQTVFDALEMEDEPALSTNFADRTMEKIMAVESPVWDFIKSSTIYWVIGAVSCLAAIWYVIDLKALLHSAGTFSLEKALGGSSAVSSLRDLTGRMGDILPIFIFAGLVLAAVGVADKLLARQRATRAYFMSI